MSRPLLVTADADVLDDLLRLAATAGVEVDVAPDVAACRRTWMTGTTPATSRSTPTEKASPSPSASSPRRAAGTSPTATPTATP